MKFQEKLKLFEVIGCMIVFILSIIDNNLLSAIGWVLAAIKISDK